MLDDLYNVLTKFIVLQLETFAKNGIFKPYSTSSYIFKFESHFLKNNW